MNKMNQQNSITSEKLKKYFDITGRALKKVKIVSKNQIMSDKVWKKNAEDFLDMAQRYFDDAHYFEKKGDVVTAFAALNYAHGWLDAGARICLFDVGGDSELFVVDDEFVKKKSKNKSLKLQNEKK